MSVSLQENHSRPTGLPTVKLPAGLNYIFLFLLFFFLVKEVRGQHWCKIILIENTIYDFNYPQKKKLQIPYSPINGDIQWWHLAQGNISTNDKTCHLSRHYNQSALIFVCTNLNVHWMDSKAIGLKFDSKFPLAIGPKFSPCELSNVQNFFILNLKTKLELKNGVWTTLQIENSYSFLMDLIWGWLNFCANWNNHFR